MRHYWSEEEIEFIKKIYPFYSNKDIVEMVFEEFGFKTSVDMVQNVKSRYNLPGKEIPNGGQFKDGFTPWNKGQIMRPETREKLKDTWFQKGHRTHNHRPIGSTRVDPDGYTYIKIADPKEWVLYHQMLWEKAHGEKIKDDEVVIFADGDKSNFDIDNLVKINRKNLAFLNRKGLIFEDKDLTKAGVIVSKLNEEINKRKK